MSRSGIAFSKSRASSFSRSFRRLLAGVILRGKLLRWWVSRKTRKVERIYLRELIDASNSPPPSIEVPRLRRSRAVRRMVFIGDILWEANELLPELQRFLEVEVLDLRPSLQSAIGGETPAIVAVRAVRKFLTLEAALEPDVILLYARASLLSEELFTLIRERWSCPLIGMNLDDKVSFLPNEIFADHNGGYVRWATFFDVNLTNSLAVSDWYRVRKLPVVYFPPGFKRTDTAPEAVGHYEHELSFLGACKPDRERLIRQLGEAGVAVKLFGAGWPGRAWVEDPVQIFRRSQINLGIGFATAGVTNLKNRDFECPGVGACYLTTYNWELAPYFEIGREILLYRDTPELVEMFAWYRRRPEVCMEISHAAYERCLREHTWEHRFRRLFHDLGILPS